MSTSTTALAAATWVVDNQQAKKFGGVWLDYQTAHLILDIHTKFANREAADKFGNLTPAKAGQLAWRLVGS